MRKLLEAFSRDEEAVTLVEYGLIAAAITVGAIPILTTIGTAVQAKLTTLSTAIP